MEAIFSPNDVPDGTLFKYKNNELGKVCIGEVKYNYGVGRNMLMLWDIECLKKKAQGCGDYRVFPFINFSDLICFLAP